MECLPLMTAGRKTRIWDLGAGSREQGSAPDGQTGDELDFFHSSCLVYCGPAVISPQVNNNGSGKTSKIDWTPSWETF